MDSSISLDGFPLKNQKKKNIPPPSRGPQKAPGNSLDSFGRARARHLERVIVLEQAGDFTTGIWGP
jgi:hypothetical protein